MMKPDLDDLAYLINGQAKAKGWNREKLECIRRAKIELEELEQAIKEKKSGMIVAVEGIDVLYFVLQAVRDHDHNVSIMKAFDKKYEANWTDKKKTWIDGKMQRK